MIILQKRATKLLGTLFSFGFLTTTLVLAGMSTATAASKRNCHTYESSRCCSGSVSSCSGWTHTKRKTHKKVTLQTCKNKCNKKKTRNTNDDCQSNKIDTRITYSLGSDATKYNCNGSRL